MASAQPYLNFDGDARQAMEYYKGVFGGELAMNTFGEYGQENARQAPTRSCTRSWRPAAGSRSRPSDTRPGCNAPRRHHVHQPERGRRRRAAPAAGLSGRRHRDHAPEANAGATSSACASTGSGSPGWSTSPSRRPDRSRLPVAPGADDGLQLGPTGRKAVKAAWTDSVLYRVDLDGLERLRRELDAYWGRRWGRSRTPPKPRTAC